MSPPLKSLVGQFAFAVEEAGYTWEDVILAARAWGDWAALEAEVREGIACLQHRRATGEDLTEEEAEAAATEFRLAHDLLTAAQTEAWLQERGLSVENWMKYVRRSLLRRKWSATLPDFVARYPASDRQLNHAWKIVGLCSGHFARFARKLAGRAAVHASMQDAGSESTPVAEDAAACELLGLAADVIRARLEALSRLEQSFQQFARQVLTPEAVRRQIQTRHTDWIRFTYCWVGFSNEAMAREAVLCVREDGEGLAEVAARARTTLQRGQLCLEQLASALHDPFLCAREGELLGPLEQGGEFRLFTVLEKISPRENDPAIRRRAEQTLLNSAIDREMSSRVRWPNQA